MGVEQLAGQQVVPDAGAQQPGGQLVRSGRGRGERVRSGTGGTPYTHDAAGNLTSIDRPGTDEDLVATYGALSRTTRRTEP